MNVMNVVQKLFSIKNRSSAGNNATFLRLCMQALPMYLFPWGYSLPPLSLLVIVNTRCNLRCKICDVGQKNRDSIFFQTMVGPHAEDMSIETYKAIVSQLSRSTFISITSTEPLLWKPLCEAVRWTVGAGWQINLTTNGFLLPEFAAELVRAGLHKLTVSIDGPEEIHNHARGVNTSYQRAIEGIHTVFEKRLETGTKHPAILINTVLSPLNQGTIAEFVRALPMDMIDQISIELMTFCNSEIATLHNKKFGELYPASETCLSGGIDPRTMDIDWAISDVREAINMFPKKIVPRFPLKNEILHDYFFKPEIFLSNARCIFPFFTAQVESRGNLIVLTRCFPISFGNVVERGFKTVWNSEQMRSFRKDIRHGERMPYCSRCEGLLYDL